MNVNNPLDDWTWTVHTVIAITGTLMSTTIGGSGGEIETVLKGIFKCGSTSFPSSVALYRNVSWHIVVVAVIGIDIDIDIDISIRIVWTGDRDWMNRVRIHVRIGMIVPDLISVCICI